MTFDTDQEAVLADESSCLLVEAPPGSGKTRTAFRLRARAVEVGRVGSTQRALVLTFSRNARAQLDRYAEEILSPAQRERTEITNYHSWFWSKVDQYHMSLGLPEKIEIATQKQRRDDVSAAMEAVGLAPVDRGKGPKVADYTNALEYGLDEGRPERLSPNGLEKGDEVGALLRQRHQISGIVHYDDLAYYMWRLIDGSSTLRDLWRHKYPVVVLDEYQDSSPLQAAIVGRLARPGHHLYVFADPLQQIYTWRDASKNRLSELRRRQPSEHRLRTLHRYDDRPALQAWMQQARDVLLDDGASVTVALPPEITVLRYDPSQPERGKVWGAETRELWQLNAPIAAAFSDSQIETIAVLCRRRQQLAVVEKRLAASFRCGRLRASEEGLDQALHWAEGYASAVSPEHHARRLLELAKHVAPRHQGLGLEDRIDVEGFNIARLREPRRGLAKGFNELLPLCATLSGSFRAAHGALRLAARDQDSKVIDWDLFYAVQRVLQSSIELPDAEALEKAKSRVRQARFATSPSPRRGLYLLSCHEGKGKEFDLVILPHVSTPNFADDEESRQLLYVSLTRARRRILIRLGEGQIPPICRRLGLA
jgi:superfamily I DNA/RNA helicase